MKTIVIMWFLMVAPSASDCDLEHNYTLIEDFGDGADCDQIASMLNNNNASNQHYWCEKED